MDANLKENDISENSKAYVLYSYRWVIFISMAFTSFINGMIFTLFTSTATKCSEAYSIDMFIFSINNFMIMLMYPVSNLLISERIHKKYGIKVCICIGMIFLIICVWLRAFINSPLNKYFILITASGFFAGIAQPFLMNSYSEIGFNWFSANERVVITAIFAIIGPIGGAAGLAYPLLIIGDFENMDDQLFKTKYELALFIYAIFATIFFIVNIILLRTKPVSFPTKSAEQSLTENSNNSELNCSALFKNCNFIIEAVIFSIFYGTILTNSIVVQMILFQFGLSPSESTNVGIIFTSSGLVSAFIISFVLAKTFLYKLFTILVSLCATLGFSAIVFCSYFNWIYGAYIAAFFFGIGILPILSICYQFGCEIAFPISANLVSGFQLSFSQAYSFLMTLAVTLIVPSKDEPASLTKGIISTSLIVAGMIIGIFLSFIVKEELNRLKLDKEKMLNNSKPNLEKSLLN